MRQRKAAKKKWARWQARMEKDFAKAEEYDRSPDLTSKEKARVWASLLSGYGADNPYSTEDDKLREKAQKRRHHWKAYKVAKGKRPPKPEDKKTFTNSLGMKFVLIPAGSFMMGSAISLLEVVKRYGGEEKWYKPTLCS